MGGVQKTYSTRQYEIPLQTQSGKKVNVMTYGMEKITGPLSKLNLELLGQLFPEYDTDLLQRQANTVDILLGCDNFGLHPKREVARAGDHLSVMQGELGICLQGTHPDLKEETIIDFNLAKTVHKSSPRAELFLCTSSLRYSHQEFVYPVSCPTVLSVYITFSNKREREEAENFIKGEDLTRPLCGGCRCGKCPTMGHTYSFKEEQELKMIQDNLHYDANNKCWITSYPWLVDPNTLPDNYSGAYSTLLNTEKTLQKDPRCAALYESQIRDMVERRVARKLTTDELKSWNGPQFYITHLAVVNQRSQSTPVRIVFNSSQKFQGVSLNSCLAKGPDCYLNNLVGLLLRWRDEPVAIIGDIKKMFNSVYLEIQDQHCHRFLWRNLDTSRRPDVYVMERVNMGDTPAPAINTEAVYKTADKFRTDSPRAEDLLKYSSYVDDLVNSFDNLEVAEKVTGEAEDMLNKGGFKVKCLQFSGENSSSSKERSAVVTDGQVKSLLKGTDDNIRVLGVGRKPKHDVIVFQVTLNVSNKRKGQRTQSNLTKADLPQSIPLILKKRMVLEQVMSIYDPLGFICPFTLTAKVYLRDTWERKLDWDDQLPDDMRQKWIRFFTTMFEVENLELPRCLHPPEAVGRPWLLIFSDGSDMAYGFVAYIMWKLQDGHSWCRLILAKCRIAPLKKLSAPQMELNAAVLSKRARTVIQRESRFDFERVLYLVDSETALNMLNKTSARFKVYEGVRVGEIQAATDDDMSTWAWIPGSENTANWLTRGRSPSHLGADSEWYNGPSILFKPVECWGLKFGLQNSCNLPGEKKVCHVASTDARPQLIDYNRYSSINRIV